MNSCDTWAGWREDFRVTLGKPRMTPEQAEQLVELARDMSGNDEALVGRVKLATAKPPRTKEEVGYYLSGRENDFENCFRYTISQLTPYTSSA